MNNRERMMAAYVLFFAALLLPIVLLAAGLCLDVGSQIDGPGDASDRPGRSVPEASWFDTMALFVPVAMGGLTLLAIIVGQPRREKLATAASWTGEEAD